jgi:hypothetical protein
LSRRPPDPPSGASRRRVKPRQHVEQFRTRPLIDGPYTFVAADAFGHDGPLRSRSQAAALVVVGVSREQAPKRPSLAERCARVAGCHVRTVPFSVTFSGNRGSPHVQPGGGEPKTLSDLRAPVRHGVVRRGARVLLT